MCGFIFLFEQSKHRWLYSPQTMIHSFLCLHSIDRCELLQQRDCAITLLLYTIWSHSTMYCNSLYLLQHLEIPIHYEHSLYRVFYSPLVRDLSPLKLKNLMVKGKLYPQFIKEELSYRAPKWLLKITLEDRDSQEALNLASWWRNILDFLRKVIVCGLATWAVWI